MDIVKAIEQLRELREDRLSFINDKDDDFAEPFKADVEAIDTILAYLESLPGITTESADVKHGKWESSQRTIETGTVYCSNCAIEYYISDLQTLGDCNGIVRFCPNCGARMDLKDGDTE